MMEETSNQKWMQFSLALIVLGVAIGLGLLGSRAAWLGAAAVALWAAPYIELRITRCQPKDLAHKQLMALGLTIAFVIFELIARFG